MTDENGVSSVIVRHWNYPVSFYYVKFYKIKKENINNDDDREETTIYE